MARVKITRKKHSFAEGVIDSLVKPSELRVEPMCQHFGTCGGCKWQHLPYDYQLRCKQQQVVDALERIAKVPLPAISPILGSKKTTHYRNKLEFTFSNKCWLTPEQMRSGEEFPNRNAVGFHIPGGFDKVLNIEKCWLQDDISNQLRLFLRDYTQQRGYTFYDIRNNVGLMRTIMIRTASTGELMLVVVFGEDNEAAIADVMGEGLKFRVGPKSFYQTNSEQAYELYKVARNFAGLTGKELVYDLYTGTGTIANFVARQAREVIGIEYVPEAIEDAKLNSSINGIENTKFYAGDMKDVLTGEFVAQHGIPDVMIVDPPRAGMHEDVVRVILDAEPRRIVYVSCNPATQARDIALLDKKYRVEAIQPVDMFPHTHHVENVALLIKK